MRQWYGYGTLLEYAAWANVMLHMSERQCRNMWMRHHVDAHPFASRASASREANAAFTHMYLYSQI